MMARYEVCWEEIHSVVVEVPEGATSDEIVEAAWDDPAASADGRIIEDTTTIRRLDEDEEVMERWTESHPAGFTPRTT